MKKQTSKIDQKQMELNNLLIQFALTNIKNPRIKQLQNEIDFFYFGLKI